MAEKNVDKHFNKERKEIESSYRFPITSRDHDYSFSHLLQILSKFLHSFRPVDLTAGPAGDFPLQPSIISKRRKYGR